MSNEHKNLSLWPHTEVFPHSLSMDSHPDDVNSEFAQAWMDRFHSYDYGAMTVWLMRGFGLPNVRAYDTDKHSFTWALETPEGYVIEIEPKLISINRKEYNDAFDKRGPQSKSWSKEDFVNQIKYAGVFRISKVKENAPSLDQSVFDKWLDQFSRPIYIRDVGASVVGPLWESPWISDVGPGDPSVLRGGENQADQPIAAGTNKKARHTP